jgi:hypothetical protein
MEFSAKKAAVFIGLNLIVFVSLFLGISKAAGIIDHISHLTLSSFSEIVDQVTFYTTSFLSMDIKIVFGVIFCSFVVTYDIYLFFRWFSSFKFTSRKTCSVCQKGMIRERRRLGDRLLGLMLPIKRYRCIGCADEYLIVSSHTHVHVSDSSKEHATAKVQSHHQRN